jgi:eukaryotic-like serine/threonine-protein kinase
MEFLECVLPEYGLKISYPTTWEKVNKTDLRPPLVIGFRRPKKSNSDHFLESVGIAIIDVSSDLVTSPSYAILKEYVDGNIADLKHRFSDFVLAESAPTTIAGNEAHQLVYIERGTKNLAIFTVKGNKVYNIVYRSRPEVFLKYLSTVEQMIASFEFLS